MSTLKQKSEAILAEKELKIIPENIKDGVTIFDVTGSYVDDGPIYVEDINTGVVMNKAMVGQKYSGEGAYTGIDFYLICFMSRFGNSNNYTGGLFSFGVYNSTDTKILNSLCDFVIYDKDDNILTTYGGVLSVNANSYGTGSTTFSGDISAPDIKAGVRFAIIPRNN